MARLNILIRLFVSILIASTLPQFLYAAVDLPLLKLSVNTPVEPNILFVLDDSGSMRQTITISNFQYEIESYLPTYQIWFWIKACAKTILQFKAVWMGQCWL